MLFRTVERFQFKMRYFIFFIGRIIFFEKSIYFYIITNWHPIRY